MSSTAGSPTALSGSSSQGFSATLTTDKDKVTVNVTCRCASAEQYPLYLIQLKATLAVHDLEDALKDPKHKHSKAVKNIIISTISPDLQMLASDPAHTSASAVIDALNGLFGAAAEGSAALNLRLLQDIKMEKGEDKNIRF